MAHFNVGNEVFLSMLGLENLNAISAGGIFIIYEEFACGSVEEVQEFFSEFGVVVTEVEIK